MKPESNISVVMVEDNLDLALTVQDFLDGEPALCMLGAAQDVRGFKALIGNHLPDLALIDIGLDTPRSGLELLKWLQLEYPVVRPVIMTVNQGDVLEAYQLGARGYVLKSRLESLAPILMDVSRGKLIIPPDVSELFVAQMASSAAVWRKSLDLQCFSDREKEILRLLVRGKRREAIGEDLGISFYTVRRHIQNILEKTGESKIQSVLEKFGEVLGASFPFRG